MFYLLSRIKLASVGTSRVNERLPHGKQQIDAVSRIPDVTPEPKVQLSQLRSPRTAVFSSDNFQTERTNSIKPPRVRPLIQEPL